MAKKKSKTDAPELPPFETSLESLNEVVQELEHGDLTLSESLEQYEQGVKHLKHCHQSLKQAERKIEQLVKLDEDGNLITSDFDDSATEEDGQRGTSTRRNQATRKKRPTNKSKLSQDEQDFADQLESESTTDGDEDDPSSLF